MSPDEQACKRKDRHRDEATAERARRYAESVASPPVKLKTYRCRHCLGYHLAKDWGDDHD